MEIQLHTYAVFTKLELEWVEIGMGKNGNELEWEWRMVISCLLKL